MGKLINYIKSIFLRSRSTINGTEVESILTVSGALDDLNAALGGTAGAIKPTDTKVHALQKIYTTLGGEENVSGILTTSAMIEKIADEAENWQSKPGMIKISILTEDHDIKLTVAGLDENGNTKLASLSNITPVDLYVPPYGGAGLRAFGTIWVTSGSNHISNYGITSSSESLRPEIAEFTSAPKYGALIAHCNKLAGTECEMVIGVV